MGKIWNALKHIFIGRNKKETTGFILASICFVPVFFALIIIAEITNIFICLAVMVITQTMMLTSVEFCTRGLDDENKKLKAELRAYKQNAQNFNKGEV